MLSKLELAGSSAASVEGGIDMLRSVNVAGLACKTPSAYGRAAAVLLTPLMHGLCEPPIAYHELKEP